MAADLSACHTQAAMVASPSFIGNAPHITTAPQPMQVAEACQEPVDTGFEATSAADVAIPLVST